MWAYWVNLQGHKKSPPAKAILYNFWSLGWVGNVKAEGVGLLYLTERSSTRNSSLVVSDAT